MADVAADAGDPAGGTVVWSRAFPGAGSASPGAITAGPDGDLWITGTFVPPLAIGDSTLPGDGGSRVFVARLDASGDPRWAAAVGCAGYLGTALDGAGNALIATPCGLFELDPNGQERWHKSALTFVDHDGWVKLHAAVPDGAGGVVIMGRLDGAIQIGTSRLRSIGTSTFLARFDGDGACLWAHNVDPGADKDPVHMASDGDGNVVIGTHSTTGGYIRLLKVDLSGSVYWRGHLGAVSDFTQFDALAMDPRGDVLIAGGGRVRWSGGAPVGEEWKPWIVRLAPSASALWPQPARVDLLATDAAGNVLSASGSAVCELDPSGAPIWDHAPATPGDAKIGAMTVTPAARLVIAGTLRGSCDGGPVRSGARGALFVTALAL